MNSDDKIILRYKFTFVILRTMNEVKGTKNLDDIRFFATLRMT